MIEQAIEFYVNHLPSTAAATPDTSGKHPQKDAYTLRVTDKDVNTPVTMIHFAGIEYSDDIVFSPWYTVLWNPLRPHGANLRRPAILVSATGTAKKLIDGGGLRIRSIGKPPEQLREDNPYVLPTIRAGSFIKFAIGVQAKQAFLKDFPLAIFDLYVIDSYALNGTVVCPSEYIGSGQHFPVYVGGTPSLLRRNAYKITVHIMTK